MHAIIIDCLPATDAAAGADARRLSVWLYRRRRAKTSSYWTREEILLLVHSSAD